MVSSFFKPLMCALFAGGVIGGVVAATRSTESSTATETTLTSGPDIAKEEEEENDDEYDWTGAPNLKSECTSLGETTDFSKPRYYLCLGEEKENGQQKIRKPRLFYSWSDGKKPSKPESAENLYKIISLSKESDKEELKLVMVTMWSNYPSVNVEWPSFLDKLPKSTDPVAPLKPESQCSLTLNDSTGEKANTYNFDCDGTSWKIAEGFKKLEISGVKEN